MGMQGVSTNTSENPGPQDQAVELCDYNEHVSCTNLCASQVCLHGSSAHPPAERANTSCPPFVRLAKQGGHGARRPPHPSETGHRTSPNQTSAPSPRVHCQNAPTSRGAPPFVAHCKRFFFRSESGQEPCIRALNPRPGSLAWAMRSGQQGAPRSWSAAWGRRRRRVLR